jgi:hypothetical protein
MFNRMVRAFFSALLFLHKPLCESYKKFVIQLNLHNRILIEQIRDYEF